MEPFYEVPADTSGMTPTQVFVARSRAEASRRVTLRNAQRGVWPACLGAYNPNDRYGALGARRSTVSEELVGDDGYGVSADACDAYGPIRTVVVRRSSKAQTKFSFEDKVLLNPLENVGPRVMGLDAMPFWQEKLHSVIGEAERERFLEQTKMRLNAAPDQVGPRVQLRVHDTVCVRTEALIVLRKVAYAIDTPLGRARGFVSPGGRMVVRSGPKALVEWEASGPASAAEGLHLVEHVMRDHCPEAAARVLSAAMAALGIVVEIRGVLFIPASDLGLGEWRFGFTPPFGVAAGEPGGMLKSAAVVPFECVGVPLGYGLRYNGAVWFPKVLVDQVRWGPGIANTISAFVLFDMPEEAYPPGPTATAVRVPGDEFQGLLVCSRHGNTTAVTVVRNSYGEWDVTGEGVTDAACGSAVYASDGRVYGLLQPFSMGVARFTPLIDVPVLHSGQILPKNVLSFDRRATGFPGAALVEVKSTGTVVGYGVAVASGVVCTVGHVLGSLPSIRVDGVARSRWVSDTRFGADTAQVVLPPRGPDSIPTALGVKVRLPRVGETVRMFVRNPASPWDMRCSPPAGIVSVADTGQVAVARTFVAVKGMSGCPYVADEDGAVVALHVGGSVVSELMATVVVCVERAPVVATAPAVSQSEQAMSSWAAVTSVQQRSDERLQDVRGPSEPERAWAVDEAGDSSVVSDATASPLSAVWRRLGALPAVYVMDIGLASLDASDLRANVGIRMHGLEDENPALSKVHGCGTGVVRASTWLILVRYPTPTFCVMSSDAVPQWIRDDVVEHKARLKSKQSLRESVQVFLSVDRAFEAWLVSGGPVLLATSMRFPDVLDALTSYFDRDKTKGSLAGWARMLRGVIMDSRGEASGYNSADVCEV